MALEKFNNEETSKVGAAKDLVVKHALAKTQTDLLIAKIKDPKKQSEYAAKKARIRAQSEGVIGQLTRKFLELSDKVQNLFSENEPKPKAGGIFTQVPSGKFGGFGFLPAILIADGAIKIAIVAAATAISFAAAKYATAVADEKRLQSEILSDKSLSASDKQSLMNVVSGGSGLSGKMNMLFIGIMVAVGGYFLLKNKEFFK